MNKSSTILHNHFNATKTDRLLTSVIRDSLHASYSQTDCSLRSLRVIQQFAAAYEAVDSQLIGSFGNMMN